jgi:hypothetical protein
MVSTEQEFSAVKKHGANIGLGSAAVATVKGVKRY